MVRRPLAWRIVFDLAIPLSLCSVSALAQSPAPQAGTKKTASPMLEVVSAEYLPRHSDSLAGTDVDNSDDINSVVDTVRYQLRNNSTQKSVTAYQIEITLTIDGKTVGGPIGMGADLANLVVNAQCPLSGSVSETIGEGAIRPGDTYTNSTVAGFDKEKSNGQMPTVHVAVTGIIWSDGTVEDEGRYGQQMNRMLIQRRKDAEAGAKVIAILEAHENDPDIHHRIAEVAKAVKTLVDEVPRVQKTSEGSTYGDGGGPAPFREMLGNLKIAESTPYPKEFFDAYSASYECRYERLASMAGSASALEAEK